MTALWLGILPLIALALAAVLWPLFGFKRARAQHQASDNQRKGANIHLYREHLAELDQELAGGRISAEQYHQLQAEAQRNLLDDEQVVTSSTPENTRGRAILAVGALVVLIAGVGLYLLRGNAADVYVAERHEALMAADMADFERQVNPGPERTRAMIELLESRVATRPDNAQYWYLLARYHSALGDLAAATEALRQVHRLHPEDAGNTAQLAQALFLQGNNRITDEIRDLTRAALFADPEEPTALGLAGIDAYQSGDYQAAIDYWERVLPTLPRDSQTHRALSAGIERARQQLGETPDEAEALEWQLPVEITLNEDLTLPANATLFVLVREAGAGPMPLVVTRLPAEEFPLSIVMNETMAMTTTDRLSQAAELEVVARISLTGDAARASGDLQGISEPLPAEPLPERVRVEINQILP